MSDESLRESERRWRTDGSIQAEAEYLRARLRSGGLTEQRLRFAAYCGHEAAVIVSGAKPAPPPAAPLELAWDIFRGWPKEYSVIIAISMAELIDRAGAGSDDVTTDPTMRRVLSEAVALALAWVARPQAQPALPGNPLPAPASAGLPDGTDQRAVRRYLAWAVQEVVRTAAWAEGSDLLRIPHLLSSMLRVRPDAAAPNELLAVAGRLALAQ